MTQIDLSSLSGPELRGLLDSARNRGQAAESYEILKEMADRRERREARIAGRPAPRTIDLDLGDPLDRPDPPLELTPPPAAAAAAPEPDGDFDLDLAFTREARTPRPKPPRKVKEREEHWDDKPKAPRKPRKRWPMVFAAGTALGVLAGVGIARESLFEAQAPAVAVFPQAPMLSPDRVPPPAPPPPPPAEALVAELAPAPAEPVPEPAAQEAAQAAEPASTEVAAAEPLPAPPEEAKPVEPIPVHAKACPGARTPADRAICDDPELQRLQKELRSAYAEALAAHEDRALLRERQLAWRDARNDVADPSRLTRLYEARIRKLNAAAAEARRER